MITEYFWVYASSGIFRDHEGGPAAWGRRAPAGSGCETAPGELASRRSRPPGKSGSWGSTRGESAPGGSQRPGGVSARGASARGASARGVRTWGVLAREGEYPGDTRESASGGEVKAPGRLSCGSPSHGRLLRRSDSRHGGHSRSAKTEGEPHGDRLDGPVSPGVRCLPSIRRSPSCGT